jgi:hypothetical protein
MCCLILGIQCPLKRGKITLPFQGLSFLQSRMDEFLNSSLEQTEEVNRVMPPGQVILKIYQELTTCNINTEASQLLSNLMAKFIDKTRLHEAHPAFLIIIPQLSCDEIKILKMLKNRDYELVQYSKYNKDEKLFSSRETRKNELPLDKLDYPDNFFLYTSHLHALNLAGCWQSGNQIPDMADGSQQGVTINSVTKLTDFGCLFVKACLELQAEAN